MKSLKESILDNVDTGLKNADIAIKDVTTFGRRLELIRIWGDVDCALYGINTTNLSKNIKERKLKPYSKNINDIIDSFTQRYSAYKNLELFITYLENTSFTNNINFYNIDKINAFLADLTSIMHADDFLNRNAEIYYETSFGISPAGLFRISLKYKNEILTFIFSVKK